MLKKHFNKTAIWRTILKSFSFVPKMENVFSASLCMFFEDKDNCQPFVFQIFGTVGVPNQWWCISMVAHIWKVLEIYMMGVSWQVMAMWSSSQSTIDLGCLVRNLFFSPLIHEVCGSLFLFVLFSLLCFTHVYACWFSLNQNFWYF